MHPHHLSIVIYTFRISDNWVSSSSIPYSSELTLSSVSEIDFDRAWLNHFKGFKTSKKRREHKVTERRARTRIPQRNLISHRKKWSMRKAKDRGEKRQRERSEGKRQNKVKRQNIREDKVRQEEKRVKKREHGETKRNSRRKKMRKTVQRKW